MVKKRMLFYFLILCGSFVFPNTLYLEEVDTYKIDLLNDENSYPEYKKWWWHVSQINACAWNGDGNYLAVGGDSKCNAPIEIYEWNHPEKRLILKNVSNGSGADNQYAGKDIEALAWNGNILAVGGSGGKIEIYSWDAATSELSLLDDDKCYECERHNTIYALAWNGNYLAVGGSDGCIFIYSWDGSELSKVVGFSLEDDDYRWGKPKASHKIYSLSWNGNYLAVGTESFSFCPFFFGGLIKVFEFNPAGGSNEEKFFLKTTKVHGGIFSNVVRSVSWNGDYLAAGGFPGVVEVYSWDCSDLTLINSEWYNGFLSSIYSLAWKNNHLAVGGKWGCIEIYEFVEEQLALVNNIHSYDSHKICSLDWDALAVGGKDGKIEIYDQEYEEPPHPCGRRHPCFPKKCCFYDLFHLDHTTVVGWNNCMVVVDMRKEANMQKPVANEPRKIRFLKGCSNFCKDSCKKVSKILYVVLRGSTYFNPDRLPAKTKIVEVDDKRFKLLLRKRGLIGKDDRLLKPDGLNRFIRI